MTAADTLVQPAPYPRCGATVTIQQTPCRCVEPEDHSGQHRVTYGGLDIVWFTTWKVER